MFRNKKEIFYFKKLILIFFSIFFITNFYYILNGYSYWRDEIFSVSTSLQSWKDLFFNTILPDTHPPLYPLILKAWISVFSSSEISTRLLSLIFSILTLLTSYFYFFKNNYKRGFVFIILIISNPLFNFYAQEARMYSLMIFLSTLTTFALLKVRSDENNISKKDTNIYYLSAFLLSITHYFGFIYVFLITILNLTINIIEKNRIRSLFFSAFILIWPIYHNIIWPITSNQENLNIERINWIKTIPITGTLNEFFSACIPILYNRGIITLTIYSFLVITLLIGLFKYSFFKNNSVLEIKKKYFNLNSNSYLLLIVVFLFIFLVSIIDFVIPMSTSRNFLILLPTSTILISYLFYFIFSHQLIYKYFKNLFLIYFLILIASNTLMSYRSLNKRIHPLDNFKYLAEYIQNHDEICKEGCLYIGNKPNLYINKNMNINYVSNYKILSEINENLAKEKKSIIFYGNSNNNISKYLKNTNYKECLRPIQFYKDDLYLLNYKNNINDRNELIQCE